MQAQVLDDGNASAVYPVSKGGNMGVTYTVSPDVYGHAARSLQRG